MWVWKKDDEMENNVKYIVDAATKMTYDAMNTLYEIHHIVYDDDVYDRIFTSCINTLINLVDDNDKTISHETLREISKCSTKFKYRMEFKRLSELEYTIRKIVKFAVNSIYLMSLIQNNSTYGVFDCRSHNIDMNQCNILFTKLINDNLLKANIDINSNIYTKKYIIKLIQKYSNRYKYIERDF